MCVVGSNVVCVLCSSYTLCLLTVGWIFPFCKLRFKVRLFRVNALSNVENVRLVAFAIGYNTFSMHRRRQSPAEAEHGHQQRKRRNTHVMDFGPPGPMFGAWRLPPSGNS